MDITILGRNVDITDRFRLYATEKSEKVAALADRALALEIRLSRHAEKSSGTATGDRVELTLIGPGPLVRAESDAADKYAAFDAALGRMLERIRRAKDRRKIHRGQHAPESLGDVAGSGFRGVAVEPASAEVLDRVATGAIATVAEENEDEQEYSPVVIRRKSFPSVPMTVADAVDQMELVGHPFFLFLDVETRRPCVVYRRKGWNYGVICLDDAPSTAGDATGAAAG